jgi:predicted nucleic acid-binding protein
MFLLDTNVCIQYMRGKNALIRQRMAAHPADEICLCSVVLAERTLTLVTHNLAEFSRVRGLAMEDWQVP